MATKNAGYSFYCSIPTTENFIGIEACFLLFLFWLLFCGVSLIKRLSRICQSFLLDEEFERQHYTNIYETEQESRGPRWWYSEHVTTRLAYLLCWGDQSLRVGTHLLF